MNEPNDGAPLMPEWGSSGPPRHTDGTLVITPRLIDRLLPIEIMLYSTDDLTVRLANRAYWLTEGRTIDGWTPEDFVADALARAARYGEVTPEAVSTWMQRKIAEIRKRDDRVRFVELEDEHGDPVIELEDPGFTPTRLPVAVVEWLYEKLPERQALAVRIFSESGLTPAEAAATVGIDRRTMSRALETLRRRFND